MLITLSIGCEQKAIRYTENTYVEKYVDSLIRAGKKFPNNNLDSLLGTSRKLTDIAISTRNKRALIYGEVFLAQYYWLTADHKKSMEEALKCLNNVEKWDIKQAYPSIYTIIGNLHKENANYQLAFSCVQSGLYWAQMNKDTNAIISMINLKAMFIQTRCEALKMPLNDTSINLQLKALKIAESSPKFEELRIALFDNIAQYYFDNKNYKNAIYYGNQGVALALKYNRKRSLTYGYNWLGKAWYQMGNQQKGLDYLNKALAIARNLKEPYREMELNEDLYHFYSKNGDYKTAIDFDARSQQIQDSLRVHMNEKQMSELQLQYETGKKNKEIAQMSYAKQIENKQILIISGISILLIIFFIILFLQYRIIWRRNHAIKKSNEKKDQALGDIAFIQAHELRKPLASIMGIINVIKEMDYTVDPECISKLDEASKALDTQIHAVLSHIKEAE
ncbi:tetratricopeptide repeat protein [Mucilaginibacter sp.]